MAMNNERIPSETDRQTVRAFFHAVPLWERGQPVVRELFRVLGVRKGAEQPLNILPEYCSHTLDALRRTFFKGFPAWEDTVRVIDPAGLTRVGTAEQLQKVLHLNWRNLGRVLGVGIRCIRFFELEAEPQLEREGFNNLPPGREEELWVIVFGRAWVEANREKIATGLWDEIFLERLDPLLADWQAKLNQPASNLATLAIQTSPAAMIEFNEGMTEGMKCFLDVDGQLVGESNRSGTYFFLLLAWPEIKTMLAAEPKMTLTDLHAWLLPFMRFGVTPYLDIDQLRDVCAPPPGGIGLSLRPLKKSPSSASA